jgi:hypothetical protein
VNGWRIFRTYVLRAFSLIEPFNNIYMDKLRIKFVPNEGTPVIGDLVYHPIHGTKLYNGDFTLGRLVLPYGLSDGELLVGDKAMTSSGTLFTVTGMGDGSVFGYAGKGDHEEDGVDEYISECRKVVILPDVFDYKDIVDLGLLDGSAFVCKTRKVDIINRRVLAKGYHEKSDVEGCVLYPKLNNKGKVTISKPKIKPLTMEELDMVLNRFGNELMVKFAFKDVEKTSNGIAEFVTAYLCGLEHERNHI